MTAPRALVSGVAAGFLLVASPALADWEADVRLKSQGAAALGGSEVATGRAYGSKAGLRMDFETPQGRLSNIIDWKQRQAVTLMHAHKRALWMDLGRAGLSVPDCEGAKDVEKCLVGRGYRRTGTEEANGHPCTVYERKATRKDDAEDVKLWRPTDLAEVPFLRTQTFDARGQVVSQLNLTNVKVAPQPASLFTVPVDYQRMEAGRLTSEGAPRAKGSGGFGGLVGPGPQGKTPGPLEQMMKRSGQRAKQEPAPGSKAP